MPYINQKERAQLDPAIHLLLKAIANSQWVGDLPTVEELAGRLNYTITKLLLFTVFPGDTRYSNIALVTGVLENVKQEMYRRLAAPYEDKKAEENGDVYP